jgi:NAD(P)-dependent dehydrogenase (short-subunit alcohol dehydrogenase family)
MVRHHIKAVLITGAGDRLGLAMANKLASDGYHVALHANSSFAKAQAATDALVAKGYVAVAIQGDLLNRFDVAGLIEQAGEALGQPIDGLINNASIFEEDSAQDFTDESYDRHFDIHVRAPCVLARNLALGLPEGKIGSVINIIDQRVFKLTPQFFTYTLSKAALAAATKTLAQALGPHVRVNGVAPGPVARNSRQSEADFQKQVEATLLQTGSPTSEIVSAVSWLLEAHSVTGQVMAVDGGQSLIWRTPDVDGIVE